MRVLEICRVFDGVAEGAPFMGGAAGKSGVGGARYGLRCYSVTSRFKRLVSFFFLQGVYLRVHML